MPPGKNLKPERICSLAFVCLSLFVLLIAFPSPEAPPVEVETGADTDGWMQIAPGSSLRRELGPGAKEVIGVTVTQGKVLRISIEKGDLGLTTVLYGPTEAKLVEHVSQEFEEVEISFPADVGGMYKIELRSRETTNALRPYEIKVHSLKTVTPADRKDSEARQIVAKAEVLRAGWKESSLRLSIEMYGKATAIWTSVSDYSNASNVERKAGDVCFQLSSYPEALKHFQNAAKLGRQRGDRISEGRALSRIGRVYSYLGDNDLANGALVKALALLDRSESNPTSTVSHAHAEAISHMAEVIYAKGNLLKAPDQFELARKKLADDRKARARTHLFAGYIAGTTGQPEKAISEVSEAMTLYRATGDKAGEGLALTALGLSYSLKMQDEEAIKRHREAIKIFQPIGDRHSEAIAFNAIGQAFEKLGDYAGARENYENALRLFESLGALDLTIAALYKLGTVHLLSNKLDEALNYYQRALGLSQTTKKTRYEALVLEGIALVYDSQGRTQEALKQYRAIQQFYDITGDVSGQAVALNNYGSFLLNLGRKQQALDLFHRALPLSERIGDTGIWLTTLHNISRANLSLGSFETALSVIKDSIKTIEELRENVGSPDLRALYFSVFRKHYDLWVDILMQLDHARPGHGYDAAALVVSDRSRARLLIDLLSEPRADLLQGSAAELAERERELRGFIRVLAQHQMELSLNKKESAEVAELANDLAQLKAEYQDVQARLREQTPKPLSFGSFEPLSLAAIRNELREPDTMLLEYALGDERSYLWAVTANSVQSYQLPGRKVIEDAAREVYRLMTARQTPIAAIKSDFRAYVEAADNALPEKASKLSQMLLGPVASQLENRKLLVVTEGALQAVSFESLPAPEVQFAGPTSFDKFSDSWLIQRHEISSSPSISTLRAIRTEKKRITSPHRTVAVIADPVFSRNDERVRSAPVTPVVAGAASDTRPNEPVERGLLGVSRGGTLSRLTYSAAEADAISAAAPRGTTMIIKGFSANRETAMDSNFGEYQILHFATHGFLDNEHPELSGIVLTMVDPKGVQQNGLMPLPDIYSLDLSAELTVLSACQTALGKDISGEGLVGLTHSFMSAGSKSVVASLWKVDDRATANLMRHFYESMLQQGMPTGAALRAAKLKAIKEKQWREPFFWAGFVLQGEYRNRIAVDNNQWPHPAWGIFALLILLSSGVVVFRRRNARLSVQKF
jgi:CHAT domain-containing protein/Tfp pilus assembly protein PilF